MSHVKNHDNQVNITHKEEITRETSQAPLSYTRCSPAGVGGIGGPGNYWVPVYEKGAGTNTAFSRRRNNHAQKISLPL